MTSIFTDYTLNIAWLLGNCIFPFSEFAVGIDGRDPTVRGGHFVGQCQAREMTVKALAHRLRFSFATLASVSSTL
jgi:hypothetical protein